VVRGITVSRGKQKTGDKNRSSYESVCDHYLTQHGLLPLLNPKEIVMEKRGKGRELGAGCAGRGKNERAPAKAADQPIMRKNAKGKRANRPPLLPNFRSEGPIVRITFSQKGCGLGKGSSRVSFSCLPAIRADHKFSEKNRRGDATLVRGLLSGERFHRLASYHEQHHLGSPNNDAK